MISLHSVHRYSGLDNSHTSADGFLGFQYCESPPPGWLEFEHSDPNTDFIDRHKKMGKMMEENRIKNI